MFQNWMWGGTGGPPWHDLERVGWTPEQSSARPVGVGGGPLPAAGAAPTSLTQEQGPRARNRRQSVQQGGFRRPGVEERREGSVPAVGRRKGNSGRSQ